MALSYSDATRLSLATALMGGVTHTPPATYDLALFSGDPNNGGVECTGTGYARIAGVDNDNVTWTVVSGTNNKTHRNLIDFIWSASVGTGWGTPNWVCFFQAGTNTKIFAVSIDNAVALITGDPARLLAGSLTVQFLN